MADRMSAPTAGVQFHFVEFCRSQFSRFVENVFWHCQLPHVVEESGRFNCFDESIIRDAGV